MLQPVDLNLINDLWVPNVFIYNLKTFKVKGKNRFTHRIVAKALKLWESKIVACNVENVRYIFDASHFEAMLSWMATLHTTLLELIESIKVRCVQTWLIFLKTTY